MPLLRKIEDIFVLIVRLVLLAFSVVVLVALAQYTWDKYVRTKDGDTASKVAWSELQPDMKYVVEETGRDMGISTSEQAFHDSLGNATLRPAFKQVDSLVRNFVALKPEHHAEVEKNHEAKGLAPLNPLLVGDSTPTKAQVDAYAKEQAELAQAKEKAENERLERLLGIAESVEASSEAEAAEAADASSCCSSSDESMWTDPVDVALALHKSAADIQSGYNEKAYQAYVLGAPKALELVLSDATLAPKLHDLPVSRLVDMVLTNYTISFSRAAGEFDETDSLWERAFNSLELTMWSLILSFFVMVVMLMMAVRMERHIRTISEQQTKG